jgi:hypothetical protein
MENILRALALAMQRNNGYLARQEAKDLIDEIRA